MDALDVEVGVRNAPWGWVTRRADQDAGRAPDLGRGGGVAPGEPEVAVRTDRRPLDRSRRGVDPLELSPVQSQAVELDPSPVVVPDEERVAARIPGRPGLARQVDRGLDGGVTFRIPHHGAVEIASLRGDEEAMVAGHP